MFEGRCVKVRVEGQDELADARRFGSMHADPNLNFLGQEK
jgi:hypothetical protein